MSEVEVTRRAEDGLSEQVWGFSMAIRNSTISLSVRLYRVSSRPSTRHKMRTDKLWDRFDQRSYHSNLTMRDVPLPSDVIDDAFAALNFSIVMPAGDVVGWGSP